MIDQIHSEFLKEVKRLFTDETSFISEYLYKELSDSDMLFVFNSKATESFKKDLLKNQSIFIQTIKLLALLEISATQSEFKKLFDKMKKKKKKQEQQPADFNKLLKGITKVPKPKST